MSRAIIEFDCATCRKKVQRYATSNDRSDEPPRRRFCSVDCRRAFDVRWRNTMSKRQADINRGRGA